MSKARDEPAAGAANDITLANTGNDFGGNVTITSGKAVTLKDANSLTVQGTTTGTLDVEAIAGGVTFGPGLTDVQGAASNLVTKASGTTTPPIVAATGCHRHRSKATRRRPSSSAAARSRTGIR